MRPNICIITPKKYPVPAVKGGAVEGLVENLIEQNEIYGLADITVISVYDSDAEDKAKKLKKSRVVFVPRKKPDWLTENRGMNFINNFWVLHYAKTFIAQQYIRRVIKVIREEIKRNKKEFDHYIVEDGEYGIYWKLSKFVGKQNISIHLHGETVGNRALRDWFSNYICVSNFIGRRLIESGFVPTNKVYVVNNGITTSCVKEISREDRIAGRKEYGIGDDDIAIFFWGRIIPEKGVLELINAFRMAEKRNSRLRLLIAGGANFANSEKLTPYEKEVYELSNGVDEITMLGYVSHDEIYRMLNMFDMAVLPTLTNESASLSMIEASCAGMPLITTGTGGMPEYISDADQPFVFWSPNFIEDLSDRILEVASDKTIKKKAWNKREDYKRKYNIERYYREYISLVEGFSNGS